MGKSAADLFDAADSEPTDYSAVDWAVWLFIQTGALTSALSLWLKKNVADGGAGFRAGPSENIVARFARGIETLLSGGDMLQIAAVIGFFLAALALFILQAGQRYQVRLAIAAVVLGFAYTGYTGGNLDGWMHNVPLFVWVGLLLSNLAQGVVDFGKTELDYKPVAHLL